MKKNDAEGNTSTNNDTNARQPALRNLRNAVIMSEVLSKPVSKKRERHTK